MAHPKLVSYTIGLLFTLIVATKSWIQYQRPSPQIFEDSSLQLCNRQLLTDLLRAQTDYHQLLRQSLEEQKLHLQMLSQNLAASHLQTRETREVETQRHVPTADKELDTWLQNLAIDERSVDVFVNEDLTLNDVLELMSRDDLKRLGLKVSSLIENSIIVSLLACIFHFPGWSRAADLACHLETSWYSNHSHNPNTNVILYRDHLSIYVTNLFLLLVRARIGFFGTFRKID